MAALALAFDGMLNRLKESVARLQQFSADLAHELRTPIQNLMLETEVTLARIRTETEYQEGLIHNLEELQRLAFMVDDLLFYLVCLVSFLMAVVPAHRAGSLNVKFGFCRRSDTATAWCLWLLRFQAGAVDQALGSAAARAASTEPLVAGGPVPQEWFHDSVGRFPIGTGTPIAANSEPTLA